MNIYQLDSLKLEELKEHLEIVGGNVITKKIQEVKVKNPIHGGDFNPGAAKARVGKERGSRNKYGKYIGFCFSDKKQICCKSREIVWMFNRGLIPYGKKIVPINGDLFDDRIENLKIIDKPKIGRPAGSKDKKSRAKRIDGGYSAGDIKRIEDLRNSSLNAKEIAEITGLSISQVESISRKHLKPHLNIAYLMSKETFEITKVDNIKSGRCGIYIISFCGENIYKYYIGSSSNIRSRLATHKRDMIQGKHCNKAMNDLYIEPTCKIRIHIWKECEEEDLLSEERLLMDNYCEGSLLNKWKAVGSDDIKDYLDLAAMKITEDRYEVSNDGCWLWKSTDKKGYGKELAVRKKSELLGITLGIKHIKPHRASFYKATGEYPELVRHKCNNKRCVNPDHLEVGSHSDNAKDVNKNKWYLFKIKWEEYNGDFVKLTEYFGYKKNYTAADGRKYYSGIKQIARKLGLT